MWKNDKNSILVLTNNGEQMKQAIKVCEKASIVCYLSDSVKETLHTLINYQVDGVLVFPEMVHVIELIRTFSTIPCAFVLCEGCSKPGGVDIYINENEMSTDNIPRILKKITDDSAKRMKFKGSIWFNRLHVDMDNYMVVYDRTAIKMKPLQIKLMFYLLKHINRVVSRNRLLENVWNYEAGGETRTLDVHIMALRAIIVKYELPLEIVTIRGEGYKIIDKEILGGLIYFDAL